MLPVSAASLAFTGGLVVAGGVQAELAQEFAGGGVDDADVQVLYQKVCSLPCTSSANSPAGNRCQEPSAGLAESPAKMLARLHLI